MRTAPRPGSPVLADAPAVRTPLGIPRPPGARGGPGDAGGDVHGEAEAGDEYAGLLHVAREAGEQPPSAAATEVPAAATARDPRITTTQAADERIDALQRHLSSGGLLPAVRLHD